jgi:hypothetical protein
MADLEADIAEIEQLLAIAKVRGVRSRPALHRPAGAAPADRF